MNLNFKKFISVLMIFLLIFSFLQFIFVKKADAALDFGSAVGQAIGSGVGCLAGHYIKLTLKDIVSNMVGTTKATLPTEDVPGSALQTAGSALSVAGAGVEKAEIPLNVPIQDQGISTQLSGLSTQLNAIFLAQHQTKETKAEQDKWTKSFDAYEQCLKGAVIKTLMDYVVDQVTDWIQNGGDFGKRFDMGNFEKNAANAAYGSALGTAFPFLCSSFQSQIRLSFMPVQSFGSQVSCTLDKITGNINNFMNNFNNGGWLAYNTMWEPQNNYFGATLMMQDEALRQAALAKEKATNELNRGQGFLAMKSCSPGSSVNTQDNYSNYCDSSEMYSLNDGTQACTVAYVQDTAGNWCKERDLQNTTPGRVVGDLVQKSVVEKGAFGWLDSVGNSEDIDRWVTAIINASYNRLMKEGLALLTKSDSNTSWADTYNINSVHQAIQSHSNDFADNAAATNINNASSIAELIIGATSSQILAQKISSSNYTQIILINDQKINCYQTGFNATKPLPSAFDISCQSFTGIASSTKSTTAACLAPAVGANEIGNIKDIQIKINSLISDINNLQTAANNFLAIANPTNGQITQFTNIVSQYAAAYNSLTQPDQDIALSNAQNENNIFSGQAASSTAQSSSCP